MRISIQHEIKGRIRFSTGKKRMTVAEADTLLYYLYSLEGVTSAKVYERTGNATVCYRGDRMALIHGVTAFAFDNLEIQKLVPDHT
ncbi:MAG: heavy metal translocating P-type ATPase, partial [Blautia sp.]